MTQNNWWTQVRIPEELRRYCTLSQADVNAFTREATAAADPVARLQELLIERAEAKKRAETAYCEDRMATDRRRILATHQWPLPWLPVKSQPWVTNRDGRMAHGRIESEDLLTVLQDGSAPRTYGSLEDLVKEWSVD